MAISLKPLNEQVIVLTGASSGIGLATAQAAARAGSKLVLVSRNDEALLEVERKIISEGGQALHVTADVSDRKALEHVAESAIERFGRIDTWVNVAGVSIWGRLEEVSDEDSRRLFETNFWGLVNGSLVAVKYLKSAGGALINLGSVVSDVAVPLQGMYVASKHAVKGFTDSLRMELEQEKAPVSVTLIKPAAINTPFTDHAKKYTANQPKLPPPVYAPEEVAMAILYAAVHPKRDIFVGGGGRLMSATNRVLPHVMDKAGSTILYSQQLRNEPAREREGALHQAGRDLNVHGDHPGYVMKRSYYTRASEHPLVTSLVVAAAGATAYALMTRNSDGKRLFRRRRRRVLALD